MSEIWLERTELLLKEEGLFLLNNAKILVVGLGGVGSFAAGFKKNHRQLITAVITAIMIKNFFFIIRLL